MRHPPNMTDDGNNTLTYDAENRVVSASNGGSSGTYTFDGNSLRVKKVSGSTTTVYIFAGSKVIAEYTFFVSRTVLRDDNGAAPGSPSREYIYGATGLLARIDSSGTNYYHQDLLSNRLLTDSSGNIAAQLGHYPFGESWYNSTGNKLLFTTYERDAESSNDYAMARSYVNRLGRFSSPDPADLLSASLDSPQTLNKYSYVANMPLSYFDPTGLGSCTAAERKNGDCGHQPNDAVNSWQYCDPMDQSCSTSCYANGFASPCGMVFSLLNQGLAAPCITGCPRTGPNGQFQYYVQSSSFGDCPGMVCWTMQGEWINANIMIFGSTGGMSILASISNFSAGAGDFLSFGLTTRFNQWTGAQSVVDTNSGAYTAGVVTGLGITAAGGALGAGKAFAGLETKIAIHDADHAFALIGQVPHLQIMWWLAGVAGSGQAIRIPLTPWWP